MASSVRHTNGDFITNATQPTYSGDWAVGGWLKCAAGEYGDAVNDHLICAAGNTGGASEGFGVGVLAASNTSISAFIFSAGGTNIQSIALATGSFTGWLAFLFRHSGISASVSASKRLENVTTWTTTVLTLPALIVGAGGSFVIGSDQFNEHAIDSDTRDIFCQNVNMSDASALTATQNINTAPSGTNVHWFRLLDAASAATSTGTAGNGTVTGTLQTDATEPTESTGGDAAPPGAMRRMQLGFTPHLRMKGNDYANVQNPAGIHRGNGRGGSVRNGADCYADGKVIRYSFGSDHRIDGRSGRGITYHASNGLYY